jgi:hypothetical protein
MVRPVHVAVYALGVGVLGLTGCGSDLLNRTDCYADFPSIKAASRVVAQAKAGDLGETELHRFGRPTSIRISSPETGADAAEFRSTVRRLVRRGGGHTETNTPCLERPPFD